MTYMLRLRVLVGIWICFFFKQKTAYEMRISDWSSDVCSSDLRGDDGLFYWHWDPRTVSPEFLNPPSESQTIEAAAARITTPVVMVRAEYSDIVSDESVALFRKLTPQLEVIEAKGVGHMRS